MATPDRRVQVPPPCDLTLGMVCIEKEQPGRTVWRMLADQRFANPVGIIQGGFLAAFADSAMGASAVTFARGGDADPERRRKITVANAELKISFLNPAGVGRTLTCTAAVVSGGARVAFLEADVVDDEGTAVARASSTYLITPRA